ncbi:MAG: YggS family pyridoxal phosphate enzyme [Acidimicrobiales bacterium]
MSAGQGVAQVSEALSEVRERIAGAGGDPARVRVVAVTKGFGPGAVSAALRAGMPDVGESYAEELLRKAAEPSLAGAELRWHYLGAIQRRKIPRLCDRVSCWHGLARVVEAESLSRRSPGARVFVEVDLVGGRQGCPPEGVGALVDRLLELPLEVAGLMAVAPRGPSGQARAAFRRVASLARSAGLAELSMGMSDDFEEAVAEGATTVRLGRALFGPRPPRRTLEE